MRGAMREYRFFVVNDDNNDDNEVQSCVFALCEDDAQAVELAAARGDVDDRAVEVWDVNRLVTKVPRQQRRNKAFDAD